MPEANTNAGMNRNAFYNTIKSAFSIIYPLITFLYAARILMTDNMGKINFGNSIISYCSLVASLGVTTYAVRECSKVKQDKKALGELSSQIFSINILSMTVAYLILGILLIAAKPLENYRVLICVQSASILFASLGAEWLNTAMEDFRFIAIRTVAFQVLSLILLFIFVRKPEDYIIYALIGVIASGGSNIINIIYRRRYCKVHFTIKMDLKRHMPQIFLLFSLIISQTIYTNSDMTILGLVKGDHQVGLYGTSVNIYNLVNTTVASIAWVVMPKLSAAFVRKDYQEINQHLKYSLNFIICLGLPCICGIEMLAPHLITLIAGEAYVEAALSLRILCVSMLCSFFGGWIANMTLIPAGREKYCLISSIICALINILLNVFLIPLWGLNAAALTTVIAELCGLLILSRFIDKNIRIKGLKQMVSGPVCGCLMIVLICLFTLWTVRQSWLICLIGVTGSVFGYCVVLIIMKNEFLLGFLRPVLYKIRGGINKR